jgi:D-alanine-D-alanine ligase
LDGLVLLETNTQPGMTPTSLSPEQAAICGISFPDLCAWLVEDASCLR